MIILIAILAVVYLIGLRISWNIADEDIGNFAFLTTIMTLLYGLILSFIFTGMSFSEQNVSGIVYNTKNNSIISGNTTFSIRASENTYISEENKSSYCLPPNSQYKELVNKAARDKRIKVVVTTSKYFKLKAPWTCVDNVKVERVR